MKKTGIILMVMLVSAALMFAGCGNNDAQQNQQQQQQEEQQNIENSNLQDEANPAGADVQNGQIETETLNGVFQGLADGHSAEITVDGEPAVFQFYEETIAEQLEIMETDTAIQFDVEIDSETGVKTITKLYEKAE